MEGTKKLTSCAYYRSNNYTGIINSTTFYTTIATKKAEPFAPSSASSGKAKKIPPLEQEKDDLEHCNDLEGHNSKSIWKMIFFHILV
ncbi:MAG: hypothetical protein D3916_12895 [Candidatus Electrothrix sp. MAN1_4]|nr:hypothetical protein [Candidatus Electrothrix sp. MAN1_4]